MKAGGRALDGVLPVAAVAAVLAFYAPQGAPPPRGSLAEVVPPAPIALSQSAPQAETFEAVRPVLQTLAEAMGHSSRDAEHRLAVSLEEELGGDRHAASLPAGGGDPDADLHRRRRDAADAARRGANLRLIADLASRERVQFVTALVPDYVDSQSGWVADHVLAGVQAGFTDAGYSLDRFHLPDWSPTASSAATRPPRVAHEQQPGALVFRRGAGSDSRPRLCVVLIVLETPTAGPHPGALGNAIALQREWARVTRLPDAAPAPTEIRIVGPTFSGSFDPLLAVLQAEHARQPLRVHVANGSANATGSVQKMEREFIASYRQYVSDFEQLWRDVEDFLLRRGYASCDIALLVESTPFGQATASRRADRAQRCDVDTVFRFPLHISQLRTSSSNEPIVLRSMLAPPSVPVDIREATPATDLVPALRPGMVSPTVEVNFRTLLQAIRLEGFRAVGVVATDARDALFLARELRRATPSVQLVLFGAQAIYLHSEYAPFMRGALVASTWPLAPMVEPLPGDPRLVLPSQEAHGVLRAVRHVLAPDERRDAPAMEAPYVGRERSVRSERAYEVWLSVVGSDAFWPLRVSPAPRGEAASLRATTWAWLVLLLCAAFVSAFFVEAVRALRAAGGRRERGMLAPAASGRWSTFAHAVNVAQAGALVAVVAFGATFVFISKVFGVRTVGVTGVASGVGLAILALSLWVAAHAIWQVRHGAVDALHDHFVQLRQRCGRYGLPPVNDLRIVAALSVAALLTLASLAATWALMLWFMREVATLDHSVRAVAFTRLLAGGVVSPVPVVMCLVFGLLVPVVWDRNRGTLLGPGYVALYEGSATFRFLFGAAGPTDANLHSLVASLDMPLPSLRTRRLALAVCVALALLIVFAGHGTSLDGRAFSRFLLLATFAILLRVALLLLQATQAWRRLRAALGRMAHEPFVPALRAVRSRHIAWNVSLFAARVGDLRPVLRLVQRLGPPDVSDGAAHEIAVTYAEEVASRPKLPLASSRTWDASWSLVDAIVPALRAGIWAPRGAVAAAAVAGQPAARPKVEDVELLVALHVAFILRDMVSRVVSTMTNALASLGLLTLGHLMYMFQGRSVFLVVDMLFLLVVACVALWLLVAVERDFVLSILRDTRPGRVEFNAGFIKGLAAYVVLPLVAALGAVFPEIGIHFTSVLDPLRRIVGQ